MRVGGCGDAGKERWKDGAWKHLPANPGKTWIPSKGEVRQGLRRSGLHPHPGPPRCGFDDPEAFEFDGDPGVDDQERMVNDAALRERIATVVDKIQAPLTSRSDLSEELREFLASKRAEAIERKVKNAEAAAAAAAEALEASRIRCQECNTDPAAAHATAIWEAAAVMEQGRTCECRGCKEGVIGIDQACLTQKAPTGR